MNPNLLEYGEKLAEIVDFAVVDKDGKLTNTIEKGTTCTFKMKIEFHKDLQEPIVAFTIKDMKGTEITGTNTMYEKIEVPAKKDTVVEVSFHPEDGSSGRKLSHFPLAVPAIWREISMCSTVSMTPAASTWYP